MRAFGGLLALAVVCIHTTTAKLLTLEHNSVLDIEATTVTEANGGRPIVAKLKDVNSSCTLHAVLSKLGPMYLTLEEYEKAENVIISSTISTEGNKHTCWSFLSTHNLY